MEKILTIVIITDDKKEVRDIESKLLNAEITSVKLKFKWLSFNNLKNILDEENSLFIIGEHANDFLAGLIKPLGRPVINNIDDIIKRLKCNNK